MQRRISNKVVSLRLVLIQKWHVTRRAV